MEIQIVSSKPINSYGTTQLRCIQTAEYLIKYGYTVSVQTIYDAKPIKRGIIFLHRGRLDKYTRAFLSLAKAQRNFVIYDTDDLIFKLNNNITSTANKRKKNYKNFSFLCKMALQKCNMVAVATDFIAEKAREIHRDVRVVKNALSTDFTKIANEIYQKKQTMILDTVTIGYFSGSKTHDRDFTLLENELIKLLTERKEVHFLLAGKIAFSKEFYRFDNRFKYYEFLPYKKFMRLFEQIDINLIPLELEDEFSQGRSELKYIEAGACGIASIASATGTYKSVIQEGVNGMLVHSNEWYEKLSKLINSASLRRKLGENARRHVLENYCSDTRAKELDLMIKAIIDRYYNEYQKKYLTIKKILSFINLKRIGVLQKSKNIIRNFH